MLIDRPRRFYRELGRRHWSLGALHATQLFLFSFLLLIVLGTIGFLTLPGLYVGEGLGLVDALFTATSSCRGMSGPAGDAFCTACGVGPRGPASVDRAGKAAPARRGRHERALAGRFPPRLRRPVPPISPSVARISA